MEKKRHLCPPSGEWEVQTMTPPPQASADGAEGDLKVKVITALGSTFRDVVGEDEDPPVGTHRFPKSKGQYIDPL